jgi:CubicO group peptidase (beta-lactamase class C family)
MRRVLTILTAIALLLVSLGIGVFTADLPFWRRALQLPLQGDAIYLPVSTLGDSPGDPADATAASNAPRAIPIMQSDTADFDPATLEEGANRARALGSRALLAMRDGELVLERYFIADDAASLLPATVIARPLAAMAVGIAVADGRIRSVDIPVSAWLTEWEGEARGRITLRQLLEETSGLEPGGDITRLLSRSPLADKSSLVRFATARGVRMLLGNDFESSALGFRLDHEPGGFRNVSPSNTQLAAVIVERATGRPYEQFIDERLWRAVGAGLAELPLDRRAGMPAAHCCWRATARDMLRVASLMANGGMAGGRQVLPEEWIAEMARPSRVSAGTGMQLNLLRLAGEDAFEIADGNGSALWVFPSRRIAILNVGAHAGDELRELPALLLQGFPR